MSVYCRQIASVMKVTSQASSGITLRATPSKTPINTRHLVVKILLAAYKASLIVFVLVAHTHKVQNF